MCEHIHMVKRLCFSMVHGMARRLVWSSTALSARAVCAFRPDMDGKENGKGGWKAVVESSAELYTNEEKGRCIISNTLQWSVMVLYRMVISIHCSDHVSHVYDFVNFSVLPHRVFLDRREKRVPDSYLCITSIDKLSAEMCAGGECLHHFETLLE
jgi:hypothetical protein